ncbi:hypothetical protein PANA5342_0965 [Pantoea ananatis LMG 5342]|nr:hypothetical protein PANA5342_0965 [Pantoea ananatis LMG 5342]
MSSADVVQERRQQADQQVSKRVTGPALPYRAD